MKENKFSVLAIIAATLWISISEFLRNEILLKNFWLDHYKSLSVEFPSAPVNGAVWGVWSLLLAVLIYFLLKKNSLRETIMLAWLSAFVMMWVVIGNLSVLPTKILIFAIPLSLLEIYLAALIIDRIKRTAS